VLAASALKSLLHSIFKSLGRIVSTFQLDFKLVQLINEESKVLSSVLLLGSLEFLVAFAEKRFKKLWSHTLLVEFIFLRLISVSLDRFISQQFLGVLSGVQPYCKF
jgi:hypothetical protein